MSEAKHTPGRLRVSSGWLITADGSIPIAEESPHHSRTENDANMARLAACWNACEGLPIYALEAGRVSPDAFQLNESRADQAERQRDELLDALQGLEREGWLRHIVAACKKESADSTLYGAVTAARAAIAKATQ